MAVIGKNLVTTPRFPTGSEPNNWLAYTNSESTGYATAFSTYAAANPIDQSEGYRVFRTGDTKKGIVALDVGELTPGDTYYCWIWGRVNYSTPGNDGKPSRVGLLPFTNTNKLPVRSEDMSGRVFNDLMKEGGITAQTFTAHEASVTIPDLTGVQIKDSYGDPMHTFSGNDGVRWALAIHNPFGGVNITSIGGARLDRVNDYGETPPTGYADGGMGALYSWDGTPFESITLIDDGVIAPTVIAPPVATFSDEPPEYTLPDTTGAAWRVNNEPAEPGTYTVEPTESGVTVSVIPEPLDGYVFEPEAQLQEHTWTLAPEPDPDPDPDPEPLELSGRVMALLGIDAADTDAATVVRESVALMAMMVEAYTRGKGFKTVDGARVIAEPLQAVIVTGAARYAANPSGLSYRAGSEQVMDSFKGWTLAEQYVLNNYRKRWN